MNKHTNEADRVRQMSEQAVRVEARRMEMGMPEPVARDALRPPTDAEIKAMERQAEAARAAARRMAAAQQQQTGSIRSASNAKGRRKQARASRKRNRN